MSQAQKNFVFPDRVLLKYKNLENDIQGPPLPDFSLECFSDDEIMRGWLPTIWGSFRQHLLKDPLKSFVASVDVFEEKIQCQGEKVFYELVREVAASKDWCRLLTNGMFLDFIAATNSLISRVQRHSWRHFLIVHVQFLERLNKHSRQTPKRRHWRSQVRILSQALQRTFDDIWQ
jgi:hypothetical protein